jgi:modulator of FtsH protease
MLPTSPSSLAASGGASLAAARATFLRKVYLLMTGAVVVSAAAAAATTLLGAESGVVLRNGTVIPPAVAWSIEHPFLTFGVLLGATFGAGAVIRRPGINLLALFGLAGLLGFVAGPAIWFAQFKASQGQALTGSPVLHAAGLAVTAFVGLSAYAIVSRRDFSSLGAFLSMGLLVLIGASVLNLFLGASALSMAISSVAILLFGGYVLYDTSRMLQEGEEDPVPVALSQFLNLFNLFLALLRIFSGGRRD